jgi:hypothetical protein
MAATRSRARLPSGYTTGTRDPTRQCWSAATVAETANAPASTAPSEPAVTPRFSTAPMRLRQSFLLHRLAPWLIAFFFYHVSWLLFVVRPEWSYRLNADFEDHAEHEYMAYVAEHPELETQPDPGSYATQYGQYGSLADLLRQIGHDERTHKQGSLTNMRTPRLRSAA